MTTQTPEQVAEAIQIVYLGGKGGYKELITAAIAADRSALLAESEEVIETTARAIAPSSFQLVEYAKSTDDPEQNCCLEMDEADCESARQTAKRVLAALRCHHGVEP